MIDQVTAALVSHIGAWLPELGTVRVHSLSAADDVIPFNSLVVSLLAVDAHEHLRNLPLVQTDDGFQRQPLHLRLSYVITHTGQHEEAQARLARVLSLFHTTPVLRTGDLPPGVGARLGTLTVKLRNTTSDERNHIWTAWGREARLALYYDVDVALVPILDGLEGWGTVTEHKIRYVGAGEPT